MSTPASAQAERYQLFQRKGSTRWQMRFSVRGQGQLKRSLDTDDRAEAERRADSIWYEATYRAKQGLTARAHTFESVAEEYIAQI
ncbi:MAG: integrase family protein, partial [Methylobacterium sp.]|nr:integrase family protein [Methylobacterium sp.]